MTLFDYIGLAGIAINLFGFFLIQNQTLRPVDGRYTMLTCLSCTLLLVSLSQNFNLSAVLLNSIVILLTLYGFLKARRFPPTA